MESDDDKPSTSKAAAERAARRKAQSMAQSKEQNKAQSKEQSKEQSQEQSKAQSKAQNKEQSKAQSKEQTMEHSKAQSRAPSKAQAPKPRQDMAVQTDAVVEKSVSKISAGPAKCTIVIGNTYFHCELSRLQCISEYFQHGVAGALFALPARRVNCEAFATICAWMKKPSLIVAPDMIMPVYMAAEYLRIDMLTEQYLDLFGNRRVAREEIGFHIYFGIRKWNVQTPHRIPLTRVHKYFLTLVTTPHYKELYGSEVMALLNSHTICVNSELEVLLAGIVWLIHDWVTRREWMARLMSCIRFACISEIALKELQLEPSIDDVSLVLNHPDFADYMVRTRGKSNTNIRYNNRRIWISDELCEYHHGTHCIRRNRFKYTDFRKFQEALRLAPKLQWFSRQPLNPYSKTCGNAKCSRQQRAK